MRDDISRHMIPVAVHSEDATCLWILQPRLWLEDGGKPLVRMAVGRLATITSRKSPVARRVGEYPSRVGVLCLEDDQRRDCGSGSTHALDGSYPLLSSRNHHLTRLLPYADQCS
jgi:hypothetical protein